MTDAPRTITGAQLKQLCRDRGFTCAALADRLGIWDRTAAGWLARGDEIIRPKTYALREQLRAFLDDEEVPDPESPAPAPTAEPESE